MDNVSEVRTLNTDDAELAQLDTKSRTVGETYAV